MVEGIHARHVVGMFTCWVNLKVRRPTPNLFLPTLRPPPHARAHHEARNDTVEGRPLEPQRLARLSRALLPGAERAEVLGRLGDAVGAELHLDAARRPTADGDVEEHDGKNLGHGALWGGRKGGGSSCKTVRTIGRVGWKGGRTCKLVVGEVEKRERWQEKQGEANTPDGVTRRRPRDEACSRRVPKEARRRGQ